MDNLVLCLVSAWNAGWCFTADDGCAVQSAIQAIAQKTLTGKVDSDTADDLHTMEIKLRELSDLKLKG